MVQVFGAVDLGASGGRVVAGLVSEGRIELEVVHRFSNGVTERDGSLFWDIQRIYGEVIRGLTELAASYDAVVSVGIDTWAVDYALLDGDGELVGDPYAYRDDRTAAVIEAVHSLVSPAELYAVTGLQFLPFNTIYQLRADRDSDRWPAARTALLLPDLLAYWLTGVRASEASNASTTGLYDARSQDWSPEIFGRMGLPLSFFPPVEPAGAIRGPITAEIAELTGLGPATVVTTVGSHDTASAVVAVPAEPDFAFISSGTWSLVGVELRQPILSETSRHANFTNEGGVDGRVRYLRNAGGLWLLQESIRQWEEEGAAVDLADLLTEAAQLPPADCVLDVDSEEFLAPGRMADRVQAAARRAGGTAPTGKPAVARYIVDSLATAYADILQQAVELSGQPVSRVHIVGGGSQNALLCQLTADRCGLPVIAGPVEATALGNVLVQARAHGAIAGALEDLRALVAAQTPTSHYRPTS